MSTISDTKPVNSYRATPQNIRQLIQNPCGATPYVYIETALPIIGSAVLELLTFGLSDIAIGYAHPKPSRGLSRHHKGDKRERGPGRDGRRRPRRSGGLPEMGNEIGKRLPGSRQIRGIPLNQKAWWFWLPVDLIERSLYWWMIADITKDSIYEWASDIHHKACPSPWVHGEGWYSVHTETVTQLLSLWTGDYDEWHDAHHNLEMHSKQAMDFRFEHPARGYIFAFLSGFYRNVNPHPINTRIDLMYTDWDDEDHVIQSQLVQGPPNSFIRWDLGGFFSNAKRVWFRQDGSNYIINPPGGGRLYIEVESTRRR